MPDGGRRTPLLYAARARPMTSSPKPVLFRGIFPLFVGSLDILPGIFYNTGSRKREVLLRVEEKTLILPALYVIRRDGAVTTTDLIRELTAAFHPTGEDAVVLSGRRDTKFSQKVRNLKSHRELNGMAAYTVLDAEGRYALTPDGENYLKENEEQIAYLFSNSFTYGDVIAAVESIQSTQGKKRRVIVYSEDEMASEGAASARETIVKQRSQRLRAAAIQYYRQPDGRLYCAVCGFCFADHYEDIGRDYIEIHHENPVYQYSDEGFDTYIADAVVKMKPLCANCHRMIHRDRKHPLTVEELRELYRE